VDVNPSPFFFFPPLFARRQLRLLESLRGSWSLPERHSRRRSCAQDDRGASPLFPFPFLPASGICGKYLSRTVLLLGHCDAGFVGGSSLPGPNPHQVCWRYRPPISAALICRFPPSFLPRIHSWCWRDYFCSAAVANFEDYLSPILRKTLFSPPPLFFSSHLAAAQSLSFFNRTPTFDGLARVQ